MFSSFLRMLARAEGAIPYRFPPDRPENLSLALCASFSVRPDSWALSMALSIASGELTHRRFSYALSMSLSRGLCSFLWPLAGLSLLANRSSFCVVLLAYNSSIPRSGTS